MKVTANIATFPARETYLKVMLDSIKGQFDKIRICLNEYDSRPKWINKNIECIIPNKNLTDNGKFLFLQPNEIYCTLDDDIIYPKNYRKTLEYYVNQSPNCISTFHGRILTTKSGRYYKEKHRVFHLLNELTTPVFINVCGTGVSAFNTNYFKPKNIPFHNLQKMSDILISIEAAKCGTPIICQPKPANWFSIMNVPRTIYNEKVHDDKIQALICNKIYQLANP
jgi:hypothetical protein